MSDAIRGKYADVPVKHQTPEERIAALEAKLDASRQEHSLCADVTGGLMEELAACQEQCKREVERRVMAHGSALAELAECQAELRTYQNAAQMLQKEVMACKQELAKMKKHYRQPEHGPCCTCQHCGQCYDDCRCDLDQVADELEKCEQERDRYREALRQYGSHLGGCHHGLDEFECDCGLRELLK